MPADASEQHEHGIHEMNRDPAVLRSVLVAYATKHGSTGEVARFIGDLLGKHGWTVDTVPARDAPGAIAGYGLVILGGALYGGRWHRDAHRFLKHHRAELVHVPVAVFAMGPRDATGEAFSRAEAQLGRALTRRGWLTPVATAVFGGVDPPSRRADRHRDARDWTAIEAWADSVSLAGHQVSG
jgi:menaquinone-dependent protoporphyrinogen oxidase